MLRGLRSVPHFLRFTLRAAAVLCWIALGFVLMVAVYMWVSQSHRDWLNRWWSRCLLRCCGIRVSVNGQPPASGAALLIANHVSWADIFVLNSVRATVFVGKSELRQWPLLGWLIAGVGTVFIERGNRRAVNGVGAAMVERFDQGLLIGLFPEGTTSDGLDLLPFHPALFEPALRAGVPVQAIALRYLHQGRRSALPAYVGDQSLLANAWLVLGSRGVSVKVDYLPPVMPTESSGTDHRNALSSAMHRAIRRLLVLSH